MIKKKKFEYFACFEHMSECAYLAAKELMVTLRDYEHEMLQTHQIKMHRIEHESDLKRHEIMSVLSKDFRSPMEREDIVQLSNALDDVVDAIEDISIGLYIYNVTEIEEAAQAYGKVILMCSDCVRELLVEFRQLKYDNIMNCIKRLSHLEGQGDELFASTTRDIFMNEKDPIKVLQWKSIYDRMETACDACENVGHLVESIVLKHV